MQTQHLIHIKAFAFRVFMIAVHLIYLIIFTTLIEGATTVKPLFQTVTLGGGHGVGDGLSIMEATSYLPKSISYHASSKALFVADSSNHLIRKIQNGTVTTIAGRSTSGTAFVNNEYAIYAALKNPEVIVVLRNSGDVLLGDPAKCAIRRISASTGKMKNLIGQDGSCSSANNNIPISQGRLKNVYAIHEAPNGDIYYSEGAYIFRISDTTVYLVAGTGSSGIDTNTIATSAKVNTPTGLAVSPLNGDLYFADKYNNKLRKVYVNGTIENVATIGYPYSLVFSPSGELYISSDSYKLYRLETDGKTLTVVAGTGSIGNPTLSIDAKKSQLGIVYGLEWVEDKLVLSDSSNHRLLALIDGKLEQYAFSGDYHAKGDGYSAFSAYFNPTSILPLDNGEIVIADKFYKALRKILLNGTIISMTADGSLATSLSNDGEWSFNGTIGTPLYVDITNGNDLTFAADDYKFPGIRKIGTDGRLATIAGGMTLGSDSCPATEGILTNPHGITITSTGEIYFLDRYTVRKISTAGIMTRVAGKLIEGASPDGLASTISFDFGLQESAAPKGVAVGSGGEIYISEKFKIRKIYKGANGVVNCVTYAGSDTQPNIIDGGQATLSGLTSPSHMAFNADGDLVFADTSRIRKISSTGILTTIAGSGSGGTTTAGCDATSCSILGLIGMGFFSNKELALSISYPAYKIFKINLANKLEFVAGKGTGGSSGEGGVASQAPMNPSSMAISSDDDIYFIDVGYHRIRKITKSTNIVSLIAGSTIAKTTGGYTEDGKTAAGNLLQKPTALVLTSNNEVIFTESDSNLLRKINSSGILSTIAGGFGDNQLAKLAYIKGSSFAYNMGMYYIVDPINHVIRHVKGDRTIKTIAGKPKVSGYNGEDIDATTALLNAPTAIAIRTQEIYFVDSGNYRIRKIDFYGKIKTIAGTGVSTPSADGPFYSTPIQPYGLALNSIGEIFFTEMGNHRIRKLDLYGNIKTIAGTGEAGFDGDGASLLKMIDTPTHIYHKNDVLYFADTKNNRARKLVLTCADGFAISKDKTTCYPGCFGIYSNETSTVCSGFGVCTNVNECTCDANHSGKDCSFSGCFGVSQTDPKVCSGHGNCTQPNVCSCVAGFEGLNCDLTYCFNILANNSQVCSGQGNCTGKDECTCSSSNFGNQCQYFKCYDVEFNSNVVCSGNGKCLQVNNCTCNEGFIGSKCQYATCYGVSNSSASVCNGNGYCNSPNSCSCQGGYIGDQCEFSTCYGIIGSDSNACNGHGKCTSPNKCTCNSGYVGNQCEERVCFGIFSNSSNVCSGKGVCSSPNHCECEQNYFGDDCRYPICYGLPYNSSNVCSGNGVCSNVNNCSCTSGFIGLECETSTCYGVSNRSEKVCNGKGVCIVPDKCQCSENSIGDQCQLFKCGGILSNELGVCNGKGSCNAPENCTCSNGYTGTSCEYSTCYGVSNSSALVCGGHGSCTEPDSCECSTGYYGNDCSEYKCFGSEFNDELVCSGNGKCTKVNTCECKSGYVGSVCGEWTCDGLSPNHDGVCGGHGNCTSPNTCQCNQFWSASHNCTKCLPNYSGENCTTLTCFCNNHGSCFSNNLTCQCDEHWTGSNCTLCEDHYYGPLCSVFCNEKTCGIHGKCSSENGDCLCDSSLLKGFWSGKDCSQCQTNYHGLECATNITGPLRLSDSAKSLQFKLFSPISVTQMEINCETLIEPSSLLKMGSSPKCKWTNKINGDFIIELGSNFNLKVLDSIELNRIPFDKNPDFSLSFIVQMPFNPVKPVATILKPKSVYGSCDDIVIDGSSSISLDGNKINYNWTLETNSQTFNSLFESKYSSQSIQELSFSFMEVPEGDYTFTLKVVNQVTGIESSIDSFTFKKTDILLPTLSIESIGNDIDVTSVPFMVKKIFQQPLCGNTSLDAYTFTWSQLSDDNVISFSTDSNNNLIISSLNNNEEKSYEFMLTVVSTTDRRKNVTSKCSFTSKIPSLSLITYISDASATLQTIGVELTDPVKSNVVEYWTWYCVYSMTNTTCDIPILNHLNNAATQKSVFMDIKKELISQFGKDSIDLTLTIGKGSRTITSTPTTVKFQDTMPPLINLISVQPSTFNFNSNQQLLLDLSVTIDGSDINIAKISKREWKLNGNIISKSFLSDPTMDLSLSNSISLLTKSLAEEQTHTLTFTVTDTRKNISSVYTHKFSLNRSPSCDCSVNTNTGISFDTQFIFTCLGAGTNGYVFHYGTYMSDVKTYTIKNSISKFTTPLFYSANPILAFIEIVDPTTGATTTKEFSMKVNIPAINSVVLIKKKIMAWLALSTQYQKSGSYLSIIVNSNTITAAQTEMINVMTARRAICVHGQLNNGICKCNEGYTGETCLFTIEDYEIVMEMKSLLSTTLLEDIKYELDSISVSSSSISNLACKFQTDISHYSKIDFASYTSLLEDFMEKSKLNQKIQISSSVAQLLFDVVDQIFEYMIDNKYSNTKRAQTILEQCMELSSRLIGRIPIQISTNNINFYTKSQFRSEFIDSIFSQQNTDSISLPDNIQDVLSIVSKRIAINYQLRSISKAVIDSNINLLSNQDVFSKYALQMTIAGFNDLSFTDPIVFYDLHVSEKIGRTSSELYYCSTLHGTNVTFNDKSCVISTLSSNVLRCACKQLTQVFIVREILPEISSPPTLSNKPSNSILVDPNVKSASLQYLLFILAIIPVVVVIIIIVVVIVCLVKRKQKKSNPAPSNFELKTA